MEFIRRFDDDLAFDTGFPQYRAQFMSRLESALLIHSVIGPRGSGPGLHWHDSDQLYYLIEGTMNVQLGETVHTVEPNSLVFIPAGLPHRNWNNGPGAERHFELIVPTPSPGAALAHMLEPGQDVPEDRRARRDGFVVPVHRDRLTEQLPGFRLQTLADPGNGSKHAIVNYAEVDPGSGGPGTHIHPFDQYYLVLEGELTVEVALQTHVVSAGTLVVLPAGVAHRQHNAGSGAERHVVVLAPTPRPGEAWDVGVEIVANGTTHVGPNALVPTE